MEMDWHPRPLESYFYGPHTRVNGQVFAIDFRTVDDLRSFIKSDRDLLLRSALASYCFRAYPALPTAPLSLAQLSANVWVAINVKSLFLI